LTPSSNLEKARKAVWKRAVNKCDLQANHHGFEIIYADLKGIIQSETHNESMDILQKMEVNCSDVATQASRILAEAIRRDPAQQSECVRKSSLLKKDTERLSGLYFEARLWYKEGDIPQLEAMYRKKQMLWTQYYRAE